MSKLAGQFSALRTAIVAQLNAASVGTFHNRERYEKSQNKLKERYGEPLAGGFIKLKGYRRHTPYGERHVITCRWQVFYIMAFDDEAESQLTHEQNVAKLDSQLMADDTLGGIAAGLSDGQETGLQLDDTQPVMFCGVLCHQASMHLTTQHYE